MQGKNRHRKIIQICVLAGFLFYPLFCWSADLDRIKADFLRRNYRRVIFEGLAQLDRINIRSSDELNYIMGLSYLKENNLGQAQESFKRTLKNLSGKFRAQATLALADTYLIAGQYQEAEDIYNKLVNEDPNTSLKAALLYRLSQSGFKKGDNRQGNEYLFKLKKDFPLSPELKLTSGIPRIEVSLKDAGEYCVQVGFFANTVNANNLKERLCALGFPAYVEAAAGGYRVRAGRFKARDEAVDLESKLSKKGFPTKLCP